MGSDPPEAPHRLCDPGSRFVSPFHDRGERRGRAAAGRPGGRAHTQPRARAARSGRPRSGAFRRTLPPRAFRRSAPARRRCARARRGPADHASRRAFGRARSHHEARDTGGIPLAAAPARQNDGLRHARRRRGVSARLAHRAAEGRPRRAARAPRGFSGVARSRGRGVRFVPPRRRRGCRRAMNLWQFLAAHRAEVVQLSLEHLFLVAVSTGIAILIGVPLGVALTRRPALSKPILGFANIMQTVPSLALFGFLIPLNIYLFHVRIIGGIGARTAIAALALYALLPIIRNTFTGINGVDPAIREAGRGLGMTDRQLLLQVEVPLALGVIVAGIRVATVIAVGTATIAAAIDAGGLGRYIFRGLRMNDNTLILAGAVPAALLALAADFLLVAVAAAVVTIAMFILHSGASRRIAIGSKDFTEQVILGEIVAQTIESRTGLPVERRFDLRGNLAHDALVAGEIDSSVEYTGTALTAILKLPPLSDAREVYRRVKGEYAARFHVEWLEPLGFNNTFAILVRAADAKKLGLETIGDLAKYAPRWRAGFGQDFVSRPDGYEGFVRAYGLKFAEVREMDLSLTYRALADGQVDVIAGNSTAGLIARLGLAQLEDDRHYFPPYDAVPVAREETLKRYPELRAAFAALEGAISVEEMRRMNFAVDGEKRAPREVAEEFLRRKKLGSGG